MSTITFTPEQAWEYASQWGSMMTNGDPGACMYGFTENCRPQSEAHRQEVIGWMIRCKRDVVVNPDRYDSDEAAKIDSFIKFIETRGLAENSFLIEISTETASACRLDGEELDGKALEDLLGCNRSGDTTEPCLYVRNKWKPQFRTIKMIDGEYQNVPATYEDKLEACQAICFESDFWGEDEKILDASLIYQSACDLELSMDD
jgi:hypothetical protein